MMYLTGMACMQMSGVCMLPQLIFCAQHTPPCHRACDSANELKHGDLQLQAGRDAQQQQLQQDQQPEGVTPDVSEAEAADLAAVWQRCEREKLSLARRARTSVSSLRSSGTNLVLALCFLHMTLHCHHRRQPTGRCMHAWMVP